MTSDVRHYDIDPDTFDGEAPFPDSMKTGDVVGNVADGVPLTVRLDEPGYAMVWHADGTPRVLRRDMAAFNVRYKKLPNGQPAFTVEKPNVVPFKGQHLCWLHKDAPNRAEYDRMGFSVCPAGHIASEAQVIFHMERKHRTEYRTITEERQRVEREEDRAAQRMMMQAIAAGYRPAETAPAPVAPPPEPSETATAASDNLTWFTCAVAGCGYSTSHRNEYQAKMNLGRHMKMKHRGG